jgi:outer membrane protein
MSPREIGAVARGIMTVGALALVLPASLRGQAVDSPHRYSLLDAVEHALVRHPSVGAARAAGVEAQAAAGEARAARVPSLSITASAYEYSDPMLVTPLHGLEPGQTPAFDETLVQAGATLSYMLFDGGARGARIRRALAEAGEAEAALGGAEQSLLARVSETYVAVVVARQVLEAHNQRLKALESERARVQRVLQVGRGADVELLRAEAALAEAVAGRTRQAAALEISERDLARLTGDPLEMIRASRLASLGVTDTLLPSRERLLAQAVETNPEVRQARQRLATAEAGRSVARGARWPELKLIGNYIDRGSAAGNYQDEWNAGLQLSYPLYTGGATSKRIERADASRMTAGEQVRLAELRAGEAVDGALATLEAARARALSLTAAVAGFSEVARVEKLRVDTGVGTQTDYLRAEADLLATRADLAGARQALITAAVELSRATGELTSSWLQQHLELNP